MKRGQKMIRYDQDTDTLTITLGPIPYDAYSLDKGDFTVVTDEGGDLFEIEIANASRFVGRALAAGVQVEGAPKVEPPQGGMVWYDADSSMISAFGYDEAQGILDVAFHRSGVYRYHDVPLNVFEGLRDASSQGRYMRACIIDMYPTEKRRGR
jgi:uncharacterized protein YuzE